MATSDPTSGTISLDDAIEKTVGDVMIARPKTLPSDALVGDVRRTLQRSSVRTVMLADGDRFVGAIERDGLPADARDDAAASAYVEPQPLIATPEMPIRDAMKLLESRTEPRLIVLDADGVTLRGLLCVNTTTTGFCLR